ncbi:MAG: hypothetical protein AAGK09_04265 [Planctomycetota bacterium]
MASLASGEQFWLDTEARRRWAFRIEVPIHDARFVVMDAPDRQVSFRLFDAASNALFKLYPVPVVERWGLFRTERFAVALKNRDAGLTANIAQRRMASLPLRLTTRRRGLIWPGRRLGLNVNVSHWRARTEPDYLAICLATLVCRARLIEVGWRG